MRPGQSTRWNADKHEVETYDKTNVLTAQVQGGENYLKSPRLVEYIVEVTKVLPVNQSVFPFFPRWHLAVSVRR